VPVHGPGGPDLKFPAIFLLRRQGYFLDNATGVGNYKSVERQMPKQFWVMLLGKDSRG